jgi:hypothetical protein
LDQLAGFGFGWFANFFHIFTVSFFQEWNIIDLIFSTGLFPFRSRTDTIFFYHKFTAGEKRNGCKPPHRAMQVFGCPTRLRRVWISDLMRCL